MKIDPGSDPIQNSENRNRFRYSLGMDGILSFIPKTIVNSKNRLASAKNIQKHKIQEVSYFFLIENNEAFKIIPDFLRFDLCRYLVG